MSQSDYIKYKRVSQQLKEQVKLPPILSGQNYVDFKEFSLENTILNHLPRYDKYIPQSVPVVFGMEKYHHSTCQDFQLCEDTNTRPNRHLQSPNPLAPSMPLIQHHQYSWKRKKLGQGPTMQMTVPYAQCFQ